MKPFRRAFFAATALAGAAAVAAAQTPAGVSKKLVAPTDAAAFRDGNGAPELTADQVRRRAAAAKTRADHLALEEYFATLAKKEAAKAENYSMWARAYRAGVRKGTYESATFFDSLAHRARKGARDATAAANLHKQLANIG